MFNTTVVKPADVSVKVEQQPLDAADAARLYGELKARAEAEVQGAVIQRCGVWNEFKVALIEGMNSFSDDSRTARIIFDLNGHTFDLAIKYTREDLIEKLQLAAYEALAHDLTYRLLRYFLPNKYGSFPK